MRKGILTLLVVILIFNNCGFVSAEEDLSSIALSVEEETIEVPVVSLDESEDSFIWSDVEMADDAGASSCIDGGQIIITSIDAPKSITAYYGASEEEIKNVLPKKLIGYDIDGCQVEIPVQWVSEGEYLPNKFYSYQFNAEIDQDIYILSGDAELPYLQLLLTNNYYGEELVGSATGITNETVIYDFLRNNLGCNVATACGILANIYSESAFDPNARCIDTNGLESYGICQWNGSRNTAMRNWCSDHGYAANSINGQLGYLQEELYSTEKSAWSKMQGFPNTAQGAYDAGYAWARYFERCASQYYNGRGNLARDTYWPAYCDIPVDTIPPTIEDVYIKDIDKNGYTIHCIVRDNIGLGRVQFPTWTSNADSSGNKQDDIIWGSAGAVGGIGYELNYRVNYSDHNNEKECFYYTDIYCNDAAGNSSVYKTVTHYPEDIAPTVTDIEITEITSEGYRITCTVTDNVQVSRVSFPTWTARVVNGTDQDDIKWGEGTLSGNKATFYVKRSDHNGEYGLYHNHIYAHDAAENITCVVAPSVTVPDPRLQDDSDSPVITSSFNGHKYEVYDLSLGWKAAKSFCEEHGGHLVTITDAEENEAVTQLIRQGGKGYYLIGCSDEESEGNWVWITGEQFSYNNWDPQGEPSGNTTENWAMIVSIDNPPNKQFGEWVDMPEKSEEVGYYNYANSGFVCEYEMEERDLSDCQITLDEEAFIYTGTEKEPSVTVRYGDSLLSEGTDYYVSYSKNVNAGDAIVTITGMGNYSGSSSKTFTISAASISSATVSGISNKTYNGSAQTQSPTVKANGKILVNGTDYTLSYANNMNAGTATITIIGKGNYTGKVSRTFSIAKAAPTLMFKSAALSKRTGDDAFTNALTKTTDGAITFKSSNTDVAAVNSTSGKVTIKGAGTATITAIAAEGTNYQSGSASYTLTVTESKTDISGCTVTISPTSYIYNGKARTPSVTVNNGTVALTADTDYTVSYANNTNAGTATVTITGKGNYTGINSATFTINKAAAILTFASTSISKTTSDAAFTNSLTKTTDGTVTFRSSNTSVATVNSTSGLVTIKGAGETTITASASAGTNYKAGSASYTLTVTAQASAGFSDVQDPTHPYYKAIYWAAEEGITKGYSDGTFGINRSCTRGEMMMFLWKYARKPAPKYTSESPFKDVSNSHAFYKAILWGYQKGITKGYSDGSFGIDRNVSRGEAMMFLWKLKGKPAPTTVSNSPFKDVPTSHAFYKAILWGSQNGITKGYTTGPDKGKFGINDNCTRGQIVTFLYKAR